MQCRSLVHVHDHLVLAFAVLVNELSNPMYAAVVVVTNVGVRTRDLRVRSQVTYSLNKRDHLCPEQSLAYLDTATPSVMRDGSGWCFKAH
ncbi:hypothetical protein TNCV_1675251 [Trichonephila clavipes]|nr:hypothetical protein TNCV_1675251 [Trichonephila clavipes]